MRDALQFTALEHHAAFRLLTAVLGFLLIFSTTFRGACLLECDLAIFDHDLVRLRVSLHFQIDIFVSFKEEIFIRILCYLYLLTFVFFPSLVVLR